MALLGPRRYGKTSLVRHTLWLLDQVEPIAPISVDLYGVSSLADFGVRLDHALVAVRGRFREVLDTIAGSLSVQLGVFGLQLRRALPGAPDPAVAVHDLLAVVTRAAEKHRVVLFLDEFSDISAVPNLEAVLRTHLQDHYDRLAMVFAGSHPSMMQALFAHRERPFFGQADLIELGPLSSAAVTEIIHNGFQSTGRRAGPAALRVASFARGHPQRSMLLADAVWRATPAGAEATEDTWGEALASVRQVVDNGLSALYDQLAGAQGRVLRAIARTGSAFSASESRFLDLSKSSQTAARDGLLRDGHIGVDESRKLFVIDPLFADWLLRSFP